MAWNAMNMADHPALAKLRERWFTRRELGEALGMHNTSAGVLLKLVRVYLGSGPNPTETLAARVRRAGAPSRGSVPWEFRVVPTALLDSYPGAVQADLVLRV